MWIKTERNKMFLLLNLLEIVVHFHLKRFASLQENILNIWINFYLAVWKMKSFQFKHLRCILPEIQFIFELSCAKYHQVTSKNSFLFKFALIWQNAFTLCNFAFHSNNFWILNKTPSKINLYWKWWDSNLFKFITNNSNYYIKFNCFD